MKPRNPQRPTERQEAIEWLKEFLSDQIKPASEVIEASEQMGFNSRTLRRAYKLVGVAPRKESFDGPWLWQLASPSYQPDDHEEDFDFPSL